MSPPRETVSALLPVHAGVEPAHFTECLESLLAQSRRADEVVIVEDGPLLVEHHSALDWFAQQHQHVVRVVLPVNRGAGAANQAGLERATGTWIAKVDADDISHSQRFERQLECTRADHVDVLGTAMEEFVETPDRVVSLRRAPRTHSEIVRRLAFNNPMNHPTTFYRRDLALQSRGYPPEFRFMQDYVLFARMLAHGARMENLDEAYVSFRTGDGVVSRRRGREIARTELRLRAELIRLGILGRFRSGPILVARIAFRLAPVDVVHFFSRRVLARRVDDRADR